MRHMILLDKKIPNNQYLAWKKEDTAFWERYLGITPTYIETHIDYSNYPTYTDSDGDIRPEDAYLQGLTIDVVKKYGEFAYDFIMVMIHEDNWKSDTDFIKGIWGTNYSYIFGKQCLEYCRWDRDNSANTFGTAYHERHHSFDALIKVETGVNIEPILGVVGFDKAITHGGVLPWKYIRHKENLESLRIMKPHLVKAFEVRKAKHDEVIKGMKNKIISLATKLLYLLRIEFAKKYGVPKNTQYDT